MTIRTDATQQIVGRERRERVSQLAWCGGGCFDSRRRVNSDVRWLSRPDEGFATSYDLLRENSWSSLTFR